MPVVDAVTAAITARTVVVSGAATVLAVLVGVPLGYAIARRRFRGRTALLGVINTGMGMPPVVVGLVVWLLLVRSGPFGGLDLIYTRRAMVLAQFLIATPIVIGFTTAAFQALPPRLGDLLVVLGASRLRMLWLLAREAKLGLLVAVMAAFGAIVSEVGASMVVGGNLERSTRVLTTAIVTETSRGEIERALVLGLVLLALSFAVNLTLTMVQQVLPPLMDLHFDGVRVARAAGFTLDIPALRVRGGRVTAVLGPNGSGKTTLLRLIAGLDRPDEGQIRFGDGAAGRRPPVGFVFQEQVFVRDSVRGNLDLGLRLRGVPQAERRARVDEAATLLGIAHLLERRADHLSGGEGRRVSLARALCLRSPIVLLDEPLEGLDERTYARLLDELPQLLSAFEATTLLVTHDRREALRLAEDLIVLVGGQVHACGAKRDVVLHPRTAAVAEVLGYVVLTAAGQQVAVPANGLKPGQGPMSFSMRVGDVFDMVDGWDVAGRVGDVAVHVVWPAAGALPQRGDSIVVHAERYCELA